MSSRKQTATREALEAAFRAVIWCKYIAIPQLADRFGVAAQTIVKMRKALRKAGVEPGQHFTTPIKRVYLTIRGWVYTRSKHLN